MTSGYSKTYFGSQKRLSVTFVVCYGAWLPSEAAVLEGLLSTHCRRSMAEFLHR